MKIRLGCVLAVSLCGTAQARADYMDVIGVVPGGIGLGSFTGAYNGIGVGGAFTAGGGTAFAPAVASPAAVIGFSTVDGGSPQHSFGPPFSPTKPLSDRVGYEATGVGVTTVTVVFDSPVINAVIHVSHIDTSFLDFAPSVPFGLTGVGLISGNGGGGDGLGVGGGSGFQIFDLDATTIDFIPNTMAPPLVGARSAYGSVLLLGAYDTLRFDIVHPVSTIDNATFNFSSVPEPTTVALMGLVGVVGLVAGGRVWYRRRREQLEL